MNLRLGDLAPDFDAETTENGATSYPATLLSVDTGCEFVEFEQKLHRAVPEAPMFLLSALIAQCAHWDEIVRATTDHTPYGFVRYWSSPSSRLVHAAGRHGCASSYLIGNYELAEQMYRYDPAAMLHASLRLLVHQQHTPTAMLSFDLPSAQFTCFGDQRIAAVGQTLDEKLATLLEHLGASVPRQLRHPPPIELAASPAHTHEPLRHFSALLDTYTRCFDWLVASSGAEPGEKVLDVGCGTGYFAGRIAPVVDPFGTVTGSGGLPLSHYTTAQRPMGRGVR